MVRIVHDRLATNMSACIMSRRRHDGRGGKSLLLHAPGVGLGPAGLEHISCYILTRATLSCSVNRLYSEVPRTQWPHLMTTLNLY